MSRDWKLKGRGAANMVFSYCGNDPRMRGHVLRIRQASAHVLSALDHVLWRALNHTSGCGIEFELAYMAYVMAPLLGHEHVFPGTPISVPEELQAVLDSSTSSSSGMPALMQPDHTTFHSRGAPGYIGVGPAVCLEIKPKWGLDPRKAPESCGVSVAHPHTRPDGGTVDAAPDAQRAGDPAAAAALAATGGGLPAGVGRKATSSAVAALEHLGDPSCERSADGGLPSEAPEGTHIDIRQRYPRFLLHMLYKHVKDGSPLSHYNPLDLFSGEQDGIRRALWNLLSATSNNLSVFRDGVLVYGRSLEAVKQEDSIIRCEVTVGTPSQQQKQEPQQQQQPQDALWLAAQLTDFVEATGSQEEAREDTADHTAASDQVRPFGAQGSPDQLAVLDALVRLTALALQQEGLLDRLKSVQAMDDVGPEGALRLYDQWLKEVQPALAGQRAHTPSGGQRTVDDTNEGATAHGANLSADSSSSSSAATAIPDVASSSAAMGAAAATCSDSSAIALRRYLMSATAKDCGIMVTLQRAVPVGAAVKEAAAPSGAAPPVTEPDIAQTDSPLEQQQLEQQQPQCVRLLQDPLQPGVTYMYKVAVVDLDVKALAKIPCHVELEQSLVVCAQQHLGQLRMLAQQAGWPCM